MDRSCGSDSNKEEEDNSHDFNDSGGNKNKNKNARAIAVSSSAIATISHDHAGGDENAPPPPPSLVRLHLYHLPDIAHDAVASYLTMKDMHCMMESSPWLMGACGGKIKKLKLVDDEAFDMASVDGEGGEEKGEDKEGKGEESQGLHTTIDNTLGLSALRRRPGLVHIVMGINERMGVVVEAMRKSYLNKLQALEVVDVPPKHKKPERIQALCDALADGVCSKVNKLVISYCYDVVEPLSIAFRSRMEKGKGSCGLKSLEIKDGEASSLSSWLSSGACEAHWRSWYWKI